MTVISHNQFHGLRDEVNNLSPDWGNESGFSVRLHQGPSGELVKASNANMVGGVVPTTTHNAPINSRQLVQFGRTHQDVLNRSDMYMGSWHEGNRQPRAQIDLDVSQSFPRTAEGRKSARVATITRNEKAYGEVGDAPDDYETHTNPFRGPLNSEGSIHPALARLRSSPQAYASVVIGDVLGGMSSWINK